MPFGWSNAIKPWWVVLIEYTLANHSLLGSQLRHTQHSPSAKEDLRWTDPCCTTESLRRRPFEGRISLWWCLMIGALPHSISRVSERPSPGLSRQINHRKLIKNKAYQGAANYALWKSITQEVHGLINERTVESTAIVHVAAFYGRMGRSVTAAIISNN